MPLPFWCSAWRGWEPCSAARPRGPAWLILATGASAAALLLVLMPSRVNIGLRHALAVYPLLRSWRRTAQPGSGDGRRSGSVRCWSRDFWAGRSRLGRTAPDYIAYFNELAPGPPERYLIDSDLDWGQDLGRLADTLKARGIREVALLTTARLDPRAVGIERVRWLRPFTPDTGWIAISVFALKMVSGTSRPGTTMHGCAGSHR